MAVTRKADYEFVRALLRADIDPGTMDLQPSARQAWRDVQLAEFDQDLEGFDAFIERMEGRQKDEPIPPEL